MSLHVYYFVGEYEAHHVVAYDEADAASVLFEWIATKSGAAEEYMEQMPEAPFGRPGRLDDDATLTLGDDDSPDGEQREAGEWAAQHGRGHLSWSEIG